MTKTVAQKVGPEPGEDPPGSESPVDDGEID